MVSFVFQYFTLQNLRFFLNFDVWNSRELTRRTCCPNLSDARGGDSGLTGVLFVPFRGQHLQIAAT